MILYYRENTQVTGEADYTSRNIVACPPGWTGPECDACEGFGFSTESGCTECIQNGKWTGTWLVAEPMIIYLTFEGTACAELVSGMCIQY